MLNKAIIGKKVGMTQIFNADGKVIPCTVIEAGPCVVTQLKTEEKDGYNAVQFGFEDVKEARDHTPSGECESSVRLPLWNFLLVCVPYIK